MSKKIDNATALYMEGIRDGNVRSAVETYTGDRYTQHSTGVADGVEGFVEFFESLSTSTKTSTMAKHSGSPPTSSTPTQTTRSSNTGM